MESGLPEPPRHWRRRAGFPPLHGAALLSGEAEMAARGAGAGTAATGGPATSFQRKAAAGSRLAAVPGTRPSVRHGQLLLSSGLPSLDGVLGWWRAAPASLQPAGGTP